MDRCPNCGWGERGRDERDFGWRGTELDRGFAGHYPYGPHDRHPGDRDDRVFREEMFRGDRGRYDRDRYRDDDRYRYASGDPYMDRGYERGRDDDRDRDVRFRDREYGRDDWRDYPWNRYRR